MRRAILFDSRIELLKMPFIQILKGITGAKGVQWSGNNRFKT